MSNVTKPAWASAHGTDEYGQYADLVHRGVTQRFRWIEPGEFLMGSPEAEPGRRNNETQHLVRLTEGYWMADTACTQALWKAVMGENPSRFQGENNPVESVPWIDVKQFITKLNSEVGCTVFRLPSEAEWEYACRAGTTTPFFFGDSIHSDQVNFDGNYPYTNSSESAYRETTVPVKSLPCNAWGLYEMHGNVWEWCSDWCAPYTENVVLNPQGPNGGAERVLRGGSWFDLAQFCRSAYRDRLIPKDAAAVLGFRLASETHFHAQTQGLNIPARPEAYNIGVEGNTR